MANLEHLKLLRQRVDAWNAWRAKEPSIVPDLSGADLSSANLSKANLYGADLRKADLVGADLSSANLSKADLFGAELTGAKLLGANLVGAELIRADLRNANLSEANLSAARLHWALLIKTNLDGANLSGCSVYGISAWDVTLSGRTNQHGLIITPSNEPEVTVDDLEVAQFVHLLLHNDKIRRVIDTVGKKGVLLLGRFTEGRIAVLERLREELRKRDYVPIVFNFDKPETKDFTETVRLLAGLSKFVIADLSSPKSAPYELGAIVSQTMIPFQPIIEDDQTAFAMLEDLQRKYDWVFPTLKYSSLDRLIETMDEEIVGRAEVKFRQLLLRRAEPIEDRRV